MRVLALNRYGPTGASSRMRFYQYLPWLEAEGFSVTTRPLLEDGQLQSRYRRGGYSKSELMQAYRHRIEALLDRKQFDVLWVEKEALPWLPATLELALLRGVPFVLDYDDAVFHNYDRHRLSLVRKLFGRRLDILMAHARLVVAGNDYLAERAQAAGAPSVAKLPTVIDLDRYRVDLPHLSEAGDPLRIVWIGSPTTAAYLSLIAPSLKELAREHQFIFRVIGASSLDIPGVNVELMTWSSDAEARLVRECDIGVMPLRDTPWELGKCAYKLVQYMAAGLPCVASAIGANNEVISQEETGLLVHDKPGWTAALDRLLRHADLRRRMGAAGRTRVEASYCLQKTGPELAHLLRDAAIGSK